MPPIQKSEASDDDVVVLDDNISCHSPPLKRARRRTIKQENGGGENQRSLSCAECGEMVNDKDELEAHIVVEHLHWIRYQCPYCPKLGMPTKAVVGNHQTSQHKGKPRMIKYDENPEKERQVDAILTRSLLLFHNNTSKELRQERSSPVNHPSSTPLLALEPPRTTSTPTNDSRSNLSELATPPLERTIKPEVADNTIISHIDMDAETTSESQRTNEEESNSDGTVLNYVAAKRSASNTPNSAPRRHAKRKRVEMNTSMGRLTETEQDADVTVSDHRTRSPDSHSMAADVSTRFGNVHSESNKWDASVDVTVNTSKGKKRGKGRAKGLKTKTKTKTKVADFSAINPIPVPEADAPLPPSVVSALIGVNLENVRPLKQDHLPKTYSRRQANFRVWEAANIARMYLVSKRDSTAGDYLFVDPDAQLHFSAQLMQLATEEARRQVDKVKRRLPTGRVARFADRQLNKIQKESNRPPPIFSGKTKPDDYPWVFPRTLEIAVALKHLVGTVAVLYIRMAKCHFSLFYSAVRVVKPTDTNVETVGQMLDVQPLFFMRLFRRAFDCLPNVVGPIDIDNMEQKLAVCDAICGVQETFNARVKSLNNSKRSFD